ncbi:MAG TPA: Mur ligase domain-containing protein, partial [Xanthobacteraceae bacterium]|nr:Mur ligase domain-containing protein [Xanthobacteraceae bacterium]
MKLREILPADAQIDPRHADLNVSGVTADSRTVKRGDLFVAIAGGKIDGLRFTGPAVAAGAAAVVAERMPETPLPAAAAFV